MTFKRYYIAVLAIVAFSAPIGAQSAPKIHKNVLTTLHSFKTYLKSPGLTEKTCASVLPQVTQSLRQLNPEGFDVNQAFRDFDAIIQTSFELKKDLRDQLKKLYSPGCVKAVREALVVLRYFEDYFLVTALEPQAFDENRDAKAGPLLMAPAQALQSRGVVKLRSGDLLLSRGNAYTSAAIARIGESPAQFSHVSQVYIDAPAGTEISVAAALSDPRVYTIEAHIEVGSFTRSFAKYAQDGNARVALLRFRGTAQAGHQAAKYIFDYVKNYQHQRMVAAGRSTYSVNDNPPYDFAMNSYDSSEIFCAEIVSMAYGSIGIRLPMFPTKLKRNSLTQTMGIRVAETFAPADMEIDPNFELIAEWRDLRKTPSILKKDVALSAMYEWMQNYNYKFKYNLLDYIKAQVAWIARQMDLGFSKRLPKNMEKKVVRMTFAIDRVGESLERQLNAYEEEQFRQGRHYRPLFPEQMRLMENFRKKDWELYREDRRGLFYGFHQTFAP